jgi:hypothetical protein
VTCCSLITALDKGGQWQIAEQARACAIARRRERAAAAQEEPAGRFHSLPGARAPDACHARAVHERDWPLLEMPLGPALPSCHHLHLQWRQRSLNCPRPLVTPSLPPAAGPGGQPLPPATPKVFKQMYQADPTLAPLLRGMSDTACGAGALAAASMQVRVLRGCGPEGWLAGVGA